MKKWSIVPVIMTIILCMSVFVPGVSAQSLADQEPDNILYKSALPLDGTSYSDNLALSDNGTMTKAEILNERGVPGKGIDEAPGLQKFFNALSNAMKRIRSRFQVRLQQYSGAGNSDNITATDNTTMNKAEILKDSGVPGKGIDQAPGLQKPFNPNSNAASSVRNRNQERLEEKNKESAGQSDNVTMNKADVLKQNGASGAGIEKAPGLQKQFNPKSNASNHNH
jgi:hypothetical protein